MKRVVLLLVGLLIFTISYKVQGQDQMQEVYIKEHIPFKKPVPYDYVREADVMWSKVIYRMIDLRQKKNLQLYYPTQPIGERMSLIDLLLYGIDNEGIRAFSPDDPLNEFTVPMTRDQIDAAMDAGVDTIKTQDPSTGQLVERVIERDRRTDQVKLVLVKEKWFFDKAKSVMDVRIIGICPIRIYNREDDQGMPTEDVLRRKTFWVYFPEVRPILANHETFNDHNDAQRISFDDFFWQRRFDSFIFAESNVYNNRLINQYTLGIDALLESEKIRESLFKMEHDLWEY
ncbi:MAG: gliding motility protein GldN [Bacteroidales bacterium]|nr:gliding motility protein GldN [Bacteroidales bacterium]